MNYVKCMLILELLLIWRVFLVYTAFSNGRIKEGIYEYTDLNGWMTPKDGADLCESDFKCAGFTFKGVLIEDIEYELYFFSYVETIYLPKYNIEFWDWTSYTVSRDFILLPKSGHSKLHSTLLSSQQRLIHLGYDITQNPNEAERICRNTNNCVALIQESGSMYAMILPFIHFQEIVDNNKTAILIILSAKSNQIHDMDKLGEIDKCCKVSKDVHEIEIVTDEIKDEILRIDCNIKKDDFVQRFVRKRIPVLLQNCLNAEWFSAPSTPTHKQKFAGMNFDEILERLFNRGNSTSTLVARPMLRRKLMREMMKTNYALNFTQAETIYRETMSSEERSTYSPSFTHHRTPNDLNLNFEEMKEQRKAGIIRSFIKLSNLNPRLDCYEKHIINGTDRLMDGYQQCLVLDGLWKPTPIPNDLYTRAAYNNDVAWIILSAKNTGSQLHFDPDHMGAWNLLLTGSKWWAIIPYEANLEDFTCDSSCSNPEWEDGSNAYPWFHHILPQIRKSKFYGKKVIEFVQKAGDVLYLPNKMPHSILNLEDNVALTENDLFADGVPELVRSIALDQIRNSVPNWDENLAFRSLYNEAELNGLDRRKMRETYNVISDIARYFDTDCNN